jgi:hypothetical protein
MERPWACHFLKEKSRKCERMDLSKDVLLAPIPIPSVWFVSNYQHQVLH